METLSLYVNRASGGIDTFGSESFLFILFFVGIPKFKGLIDDPMFGVAKDALFPKFSPDF